MSLIEFSNSEKAIPMPTRPTWKFAEDRLARLFGTVRRPLSGRNSRSGGSDDAMHDKLYLENKYRKKQSLWTLFREVRDKARQEGRTPVIGIQEKDAKGILLVIHSKDLEVVLTELLRTDDGD